MNVYKISQIPGIKKKVSANLLQLLWNFLTRNNFVPLQLQNFDISFMKNKKTDFQIFIAITLNYT